MKNDGHVNGLNPGLNHLDPFDDDDADVIRISKQFEEKYVSIIRIAVIRIFYIKNHSIIY